MVRIVIAEDDPLYAAQLKQFLFFRCGKSYLINLAYVEAYQDHCAVVHGERIPVSQPKRAKFIEALNQYMGDVIR